VPEEEWGYQVDGRRFDWEPGRAYPEWALNWREPYMFHLTHPGPVSIPTPTPRETGPYGYDPRLPMEWFNPHPATDLWSFTDPRMEAPTGEPPPYRGPWTREQWLSTVAPAPPAPMGPGRIAPREALWNLNLGRAGAVAEGGPLRGLVPERFRGTGEEGRYALQALQELYPERARGLLGEFTGGETGWEGTDLYRGTRWDPEATGWLTTELGRGDLPASRFAEAFSRVFEGPGYAMGEGRFQPWPEGYYLRPQIGGGESPEITYPEFGKPDPFTFETPMEWMEPQMRTAGGEEFNIVYPEAREEYERLHRIEQWDEWVRKLQIERQRLRREYEEEQRLKRQRERSGAEGGNGGEGEGAGDGDGAGAPGDSAGIA